MAERGEGVLHGGELVQHFSNDAVVWYGNPKTGTLADRMRSATDLPPRAVPFKDVKRQIDKRKEKIDDYENNDPAAKTAGGRDWLARNREENNKQLNNHPIQ